MLCSQGCGLRPVTDACPSPPSAVFPGTKVLRFAEVRSSRPSLRCGSFPCPGSAISLTAAGAEGLPWGVSVCSVARRRPPTAELCPLPSGQVGLTGADGGRQGARARLSHAPPASRPPLCQGRSAALASGALGRTQGCLPSQTLPRRRASSGHRQARGNKPSTGSQATGARTARTGGPTSTPLASGLGGQAARALSAHSPAGPHRSAARGRTPSWGFILLKICMPMLTLFLVLKVMGSKKK